MAVTPTSHFRGDCKEPSRASAKRLGERRPSTCQGPQGSRQTARLLSVLPGRIKQDGGPVIDRVGRPPGAARGPVRKITGLQTWGSGAVQVDADPASVPEVVRGPGAFDPEDSDRIGHETSWSLVVRTAAKRPPEYAGRLADPEFRRQRAARASAAAWAPETLIKRLSRTDLSLAQLQALRALLADHDPRPESRR